MKERIIKTGKSILLLLLLAGGILFAYASFYITRISLNAENWITASTTISYSYSITIKDSAVRSGMGGGSGVKYVLSPNYSFVAVDGKTYEGHSQSIFFSDKTDTKTGSEEELKRRLVKEGVVYYNPENPRQSAVDQPFFNLVIPILYILFSVLLLSVAIAIVLDEFKVKKKKYPPTFNFESGN